MASGQSLAPLGTALPPPRDMKQLQDLHKTMGKGPENKSMTHKDQSHVTGHNTHLQLQSQKTTAKKTMKKTVASGSQMFSDDPMGLKGRNSSVLDKK